MGGLDTEFTINSPLHVRHIEMLGDMVEEGPVHLRRPHQPGRGEVLERRMRDAQRQRRRAGEHQEGAKFDWSVNFIPYHDDVQGRAAELDHRRRLGLGHGRQEAQRVQGRGEIPRVPVEARDPDGLAHRRRATCRSRMAAYELTRKSGFYDKNPGADIAGEAAHQQAADGELQGPALRQLRAGARGDRGGDGERCSPARRTPRRRSTTR